MLISPNSTVAPAFSLMNSVRSSLLRISEWTRLGAGTTPPGRRTITSSP